MTDDPRLGSPGTFEFSAPDGMLRSEWIGAGPQAEAKARELAAEIEREAGGEFIVTQIRQRTASGWQVVPRFLDG